MDVCQFIKMMTTPSENGLTNAEEKDNLAPYKLPHRFVITWW